MAALLFAPLLGAEDRKTIGPKVMVLAICALTALGGLYAWKGKPELTGKHADSLKAQSYYSKGLLSQSINAYEDLMALYPDDQGLKEEFEQVTLELSKFSREELKVIQTLAELKERLNSENSKNTADWRLLANGQMRLGDYDGAMTTYERLMSIAPDNEDIEDEYLRAQNFIEAQKRAQEMKPEERQAMIENMVSGLSDRLRENGGTAKEWKRLIVSRKQLGQDALLAEDLNIMKEQFSDKPDMIKQILGDE